MRPRGGRPVRRLPVLLLALVALLAASAVALDAPGAGAAGRAVDVSPAPRAAALADGPGFRPLPPTRLADTRAGAFTIDGQHAGGGRVTSSTPLEIVVAGRGGVPSTGAVAVSLTVTVTGATAAGYLTVHPTGAPQPGTSTLNHARNQTLANGVVAKLGTGGRVTVASLSPAHVVVDVTGYFVEGAVEAVTPARLADTRTAWPVVDGTSGSGRAGASSPLVVPVTGRFGVPSSGVTAVAVNVTVTASLQNGFLVAHPTGSPRPHASNLNYARGQTVANAVIVKVGTAGRVSFAPSSAVHVVVDLTGYFTDGSDFVPLDPVRVTDTRATGSAVAGPSYAPSRTSSRVGPIGSGVANGSQLDVLVSGRGGMPLADVGAVVLNVTVTDASVPGYATVFPLDTVPPYASSLNHGARAPTPNLVVAKVGRGGGISVTTSTTRTHVVVDVLGYFPGHSTEDVAGVWSAIGRDVVDMPLTYDRCYSIPYRINTANAQAGWVSDVHTAAGLIEAATGIDFVYLGTSNEVPSASRLQADHVLVAFTTSATVPQLGGGVIGYGGSVYDGLANAVRVVPEQFFHGFAYFDAATPMTSGFGTGLAFGQVALHELGHVVGLGHVANTDEIMNDVAINRSGTFGTGDLLGLGLLYRTQACPGSPATFDSLRAAPGKPAPAVEPKLVTGAIRG